MPQTGYSDMYQIKPLENLSKTEFYQQLDEQVRALIGEERDAIANMANFSALLYHSLPDVNWVGFYLNHHDELILGPFQGKPACIRIAFGRGVCGTAAQNRETALVKNVHEFPGHIACDSASNSEIVLPMIADGHLYGVLDIDSPLLERFDKDDQTGLERLVKIFITKTDILALRKLSKD